MSAPAAEGCSSGWALASRWPDGIIPAVFGVAAHTRTVILITIGIVMLTAAEAALTLDAVTGGRLHGWLGISPDLPCLWGDDRTILAMPSSVVWKM